MQEMKASDLVETFRVDDGSPPQRQNPQPQTCQGGSVLFMGSLAVRWTAISCHWTANLIYRGAG